jgi:hypothetical protein
MGAMIRRRMLAVYALELLLPVAVMMLGIWLGGAT